MRTSLDLTHLSLVMRLLIPEGEPSSQRGIPAMHRQSGNTLIELLGVLALIAITVMAAVVKMQSAGNPLEISTSILEGEFREARLNAIATMSAYRVSPATPTTLK